MKLNWFIVIFYILVYYVVYYDININWNNVGFFFYVFIFDCFGV